MTRPKISQMEAYMIETLRASGVTNEAIIQAAKEKDVSTWKQINDQYDFEQLLVLAEQDFSTFEEIINDGYAVKFVTVGGLERLLKLKFQKVEGKDFQKLKTGVQGLDLSGSSLDELKQMLSINWKITKNNEYVSVLLKEKKDFA
ncbi:hypothetical protein [Oceanobacillus jeddahense]|uniref:Uncharacterized protein n=1 Tax=Oceanobacillus jeddahense TaxID=1462527 RepID=A0ABY5JY86_9BACI|nr:hypothetical protein [Oceanobacillus jeddahense]UUI05026.1 hypothetical protein NP439_10480 [Oceanobacillus jeddahense]